MCTYMRPQDNFYEYVNNDWFKKNTIPDDRSNISDTTKLRDKNRQRVLKIIMDKKDTLPHMLFKLGMKEHNNKGLEPFIQKINSINCPKDIMMTIAYFNIYGISSPLNIGIDVDIINSNKYNCYIGYGGCFLPTKDYYVKEKDIIKKYKLVIQKVLKYLKKTSNSSNNGSILTCFTFV